MPLAVENGPPNCYTSSNKSERLAGAMSHEVILTLQHGDDIHRVEAARVHFCAHQCFATDANDIGECLVSLAAYLHRQPALAVGGSGPLLDALLRHDGGLASRIVAVIHEDDGAGELPAALAGVPVCSVADIPTSVATVFLAHTRTYPRMRLRRKLQGRVQVIDADILTVIACDAIPARAWTSVPRHIYPIDIPEIRFREGLDLLLLDCPARNLALMPNGLGYVHSALKKTAIDFQTFDLDIVTYHRYHVRRLFDEGGTIVMPSGRVMPVDPWQAEHYDLWAMPEVIDYLMPIIEEAASEVIRVRPKVLGLSIHQCNEAFTRELVNRVKAALPETLIIVGGFSCYNADIGLRGFPEADYMCIGESDLTVGPLMSALVRGERPSDVPGVLSRFDTPGRLFAPAPMPHNLDRLDFPTYEWFDLSVYRNFNGYQLVPIIASRGCRWSRCTFCAERFYWRIRSAKNFVAELRWLVERGCTLFMFNESDLNGMPDKLLEICDEIISSGLKVKLTGQLRINKKSDRAFFNKLRAAGFVALRFGVDAFSENTLRLQKKGYTTHMVSQNLRDCWEAGIYTEINWVIGVPGESEADCDEGVALILANRQYIGRLANINPLILVNGGVYWIDPEAHNIHFRAPKEELYSKFPRHLPADQWYSTEPYIDAHVRKHRFEHIVLKLHEAGFPVGDWAKRVIEDVRLARDKSRAAAAPAATTSTEPALLTEAPAPGTVLTEVSATQAPLPTEPPRLVRRVGSHNVVAYKEQYYGLPESLGNIDLSALDDAATMPGVLVAGSEDELVSAIDIAMLWANSRGHFSDDQKLQRRKGSVFRAGSAQGETPVADAVIDKAAVVLFEGEFYALSANTIAALRKSQLPPVRGWPEPKTFRGRVVAALPQVLAEMLHQLWRKQQWYRYLNHGEPMPVMRKSTLAMAADIGAALLREFSLSWQRRCGPRRKSGGENNSSGLRVLNCVSRGAVPELLTSYGDHNIVEFDGAYYAVPFGLAVDWESGSVPALPGVIVEKTTNAVMQRLHEKLGLDRVSAVSTASAGEKGLGPAAEISHLPLLLGEFEGYNLVAYEGFVYGLPHSLGSVDLAEVDVLGLPGVIRDVSRDVVEGEIKERSAKNAAVAA